MRFHRGGGWCDLFLILGLQGGAVLSRCIIVLTTRHGRLQPRTASHNSRRSNSTSTGCGVHLPPYCQAPSLVPSACWGQSDSINPTSDGRLGSRAAAKELLWKVSQVRDEWDFLLPTFSTASARHEREATTLSDPIRAPDKVGLPLCI